jgi:hypothetical protein
LPQRKGEVLMATKPATFYQIRMTLVDGGPPTRRRFLVPSAIYLPRLSGVLQYAMGWLYLQLHHFVAGNFRFGQLDCDSDSNLLDEKRVKLDRLLKQESDSILYEYDFGDGWKRKIVLELEKVLSFE